MKHTEIQPASLSWRENTPRSNQFDDVYFNDDGGLDETDFVFLQGNDLHQRFSTLTENHFTIAETGFGTGLSFLCARRLWLEKSQPHQQLHFISVEKYPLTKDDLTAALAYWPELSEGSEQLLTHYPAAFNGFHRIILDKGRVKLTLIFGDSQHCISALDAKVDAWFLDGFSPAKNPDMWSEELFAAVAQRSASGGTFSTFTSASFVRKGLQQQGFSIKKRSGFGKKREMLTGTFCPTDSQQAILRKPWFSRPEHSTTKNQQSITVIGAGLAGATTAYALASRGFKVTILERCSQPAQGGSGNRQGALYAKPTLEMTKQARLHITGMLFSQQQLKQVDPERTFWHDCGVMLCATSEKSEKRFNNIIAEGHIPPQILQLLTAHQATERCQFKQQRAALLFEHAGWVDPAAFCRLLLQHPLIDVQYNYQIDELDFDQQEQQWHLQSQQGVHKAHTVIIATATDAVRFNQSRDLPLKPIRGQVNHCPTPDNTPVLKTVVCAGGYISPPQNGMYCYGATFNLNDSNTSLRPEDSRYNLSTLSQALPDLAKKLADCPTEQGRVSYRCSTADYLPIVGELPDTDKFSVQYQKLSKDAKWKFDSTPPARHKQLYINVGHGSKGLITCPLSAELIAGLINHEPLPVDIDVADALDPARFLVKKLIKQAI